MSDSEGPRCASGWAVNCGLLGGWRLPSSAGGDAEGGSREAAAGGQAILGEGLTGPEARGGKSQLSALTRKPQVGLEQRLQGS